MHKLSKLLAVMHKLSKDIDRKKLRNNIYESFIRSKLEHAGIVWDDCSDQDHIALEKCQLRATGIVTGPKKGTSHDKLTLKRSGLSYMKEEKILNYVSCTR